MIEKFINQYYMDLIVGAGISGLSFAMYDKGREYKILEGSDAIGGYCKTTTRNGFVWDYSGHFFHFQDKDIEEMIMRDMTANDLVEPVKNTKIKYKDRYVEYPFQKNIHQLPKEELIDCLYDLFNNGQKEYGNFKEMLYAKFGASIAEKFLIPYNTKLYACDLNRLDKEAMGRFFPYAEKEDIIKNFKSGNNLSYNATFVYPKQGAFEYVKGVVAYLDQTKIELNSHVVSIDINNKLARTKDGRVFSYDRLISTLPFPCLLDLCGIEYDKSIYSWNQVLVFNIGFDSKGPVDEFHWIYFPEGKYVFYRVGFYDNILSQDRTSVYVEIGFKGDEEINPNMYFGRVLKDMMTAGLIREDQTVVDYESIIMNPAYVHITEASIKDVQEKKAKLAQYDVYSIGRYGSWTYCSIEDNIKEARQLSSIINKK